MRRPTCPTCEKLVDIATNPHRPFCCERCQLIDLGRWFDEGYSIPIEGEEDKQLDPDADYSDSGDAGSNDRAE